MKKITKIIVYTVMPVLLFTANTVFSQSITQTVKGKVSDNETQAPLEGATVVILSTNTF